jgi:uncharacterized membrane protein YccC
MRLRANKTKSQQQLAIKLRMEPEKNPGFFTWERRWLLIHAAKTALAAALCWWIATLFGLHEGYWGAISAIIVLQSNFGATISASRDRILGTVIGALIGFSFAQFGALPWNYILAVLVAVVVCGLLGMRNSARLAGVTITILMLVQKGGSQWTVALDRVGQVLMGILVALAISTLVFPDRARLRLRDGLAQEFLVLGAFFEGILEGFRGTPAKNLSKLREDVQTILLGNDQLLEAARNEPSGGPGWREGLGMLSQFGRSLFEALAALELAVKDSHEDGYAQQLEPVMERLAMDIRTRFLYLAQCIHNWHFHAPAQGLLLEEDIAQLEARMAEVRPTGFQFLQAEILRVYAVQLHLKQIARLLCATRMETSRAVGEMQK